MVSSEVSRGHSRWEKKPEKKKTPEAFTNTEGLNVRMAKQSGSLWQSNNNRNTSENYLKGG